MIFVDRITEIRKYNLQMFLPYRVDLSIMTTVSKSVLVYRINYLQI